MSSDLGGSETAVVANAGSPAGPPATSLTSSDWRPAFTYDHPTPMTAVTSAMLNINGNTDDSGFLISSYDYYARPHPQDSIKVEKSLSGDIWSPVAVSANSPHGTKGTNGELTEVFVTGGSAGPNNMSGGKCQSVLRRGGPNGKLSNGHSRYTNGELSPSASEPTPVIIIKEEMVDSPGSSSPRMNGILSVSGGPQNSVSPSEDHHSYQTQALFATLSSTAHSPYGDYVSQTGPVSSSQYSSALRGNGANLSSGIYSVGNSPGPGDFYRDYFNSGDYGNSGVARQLSGYDNPNEPSYEKYVRSSGGFKTPAALPVDLPSPDSGIGAEAITPRDHSNMQQVQGLEKFDYPELYHPGLISDLGTGDRPQQANTQKSTRPWHDFGRQNEADKIQIPKLFSNYGFKYYLESPISTSQRREDDRITYINKGQFYGITLEYTPDPDKQLKSQTVKTVVMLVFREEKSPEDEIKAWQFWHGRQHSVKQRILDADTKNSVGLVGCIDEIAHNAIAVYWNPLETHTAKINVAVQCLSTDFSSQKGVKGLPLHLQVDTYDDARDAGCTIFHRAYCQIKVFCDKGAERKTRDEERRAAKRKLTATGRKKLDEMYHHSCERSEFYAMSDLAKPPVLFTPAEDIDKLTSLELGFYSTNSEGSDHSGLVPGGELNAGESPRSCGSSGGGSLSGSNTPGPPSVIHQLPQVLKFHNTFPPDSPPFQRPVGPSPPAIITEVKKDGVGSLENGVSNDSVFGSPSLKRIRLIPPPSERIMIFVKQESEDAFTPLHLNPPSLVGLLTALEEKYKISMGSVKNLYRRNGKGIVAKIDDEMLKYYCNEDNFLLEVKTSETDDAFDITLIELTLDCHSS